MILITFYGYYQVIGGKIMSTFIWGKLKLKEKKVIKDYQKNNILIYFSNEKNDLFQTDLEENEIYFNIACGYNKMIDLSSYKEHYLNCEESYFFLNAPKRAKDMHPYFEKLFLRIKNLQDVISGMFNSNCVEKITYFHTDTGNENSIDEYELVNWRLEEFADKFFIEILLNRGFTPTIKIIFDKKHSK